MGALERLRDIETWAHPLKRLKAELFVVRNRKYGAGHYTPISLPLSESYVEALPRQGLAPAKANQ